MSNTTDPKRIQRQRTKGWRMPPNTIYCGRPSKWGNPYSFGHMDIGLSLKFYREALSGNWNPAVVPSMYSDEQYRMFYDCRNEFIRRFKNIIPEEAARIYLRGFNLCCWCPGDQPCHCDVLLEIANA